VGREKAPSQQTEFSGSTTMALNVWGGDAPKRCSLAPETRETDRRIR